MELTILHLYPDLMDLYGEYANLAVLRRRLEHRPEQLFADGGGRGDGVDGLQAAGEGPFHGPQTVHRRRDGGPAGRAVL